MENAEKKLLHCYNKGCGKTFELDNNEEGSCVFHSGSPYFHDAYKEWTCCKRRSTDFTEFLNFKGCTVGKHNGIRPESLNACKVQNVDKVMQMVEKTFSHRAQIAKTKETEEIYLDSPLIQMTPEISLNLLQQLGKKVSKTETEITNGIIPIGTPCKNTSCTVSYAENIDQNCIYHPGSAVFHEGLKYWSCCKKITSDFSKFLDQVGCTIGNHVWIKEKEPVKCRVDWHQTPSKVEVSIFAKNYDPYKSSIFLSPVRMKVSIFFPEEEQIFKKEYSLCGIVKVAQSCVSMLPTKIEIKLIKAKGETWSNFSK
ncbi:hypothetical protein PGB90_007623 [Kerria lacca]